MSTDTVAQQLAEARELLTAIVNDHLDSLLYPMCWECAGVGHSVGTIKHKPYCHIGKARAFVAYGSEGTDEADD